MSYNSCNPRTNYCKNVKNVIDVPGKTPPPHTSQHTPIISETNKICVGIEGSESLHRRGYYDQSLLESQQPADNNTRQQLCEEIQIEVEERSP